MRKEGDIKLLFTSTIPCSMKENHIGFILMLASIEDKAALNIREHLLRVWLPKRIGKYSNMEIYGRNHVLLSTISDSALEIDNPHLEIASALGMDDRDFRTIIYLSKHKSKSLKKTLSVHPVGNYGVAAFGGKPRTLVPTAPSLMTMALRYLCKHNIEGFGCTFEATHHGPWNNIPTFFIEIGSTEKEWEDPQAGNAVAMALRDTIFAWERGVVDEKVCIGVGGGHYAPRHTKFALQEGLNFGHIMPAYAVENLDREMAREMIAKTPGAEMVCVHGRKIEEKAGIFRELGIPLRVY